MKTKKCNVKFKVGEIEYNFTYKSISEARKALKEYFGNTMKYKLVVTTE